jgi:hypothetical protein
MNFDQRVKIANAQVLEFLERYKAPTGLSDEAQFKTVEAISQAFARRLPVTSEAGYVKNIHKTFDRVADSHNSYAWPPQGAFVESMTFPGSGAKAAQETYTPDPLKNLADMMNAGQAVAESALWGATASGLISKSLVTAEVLERYRNASAQNWAATYRHEAEEMMVAKYGQRVRAYFAQSRPAQEAAQ